LDRGEIQAIGDTILSDDTLVRRLVVLGWDTLEVREIMAIMVCGGS
jgi:hypothetical protein